MATNFPGSVDNLTNPTASDKTTSPSHAAQHANANDAIEAIESFALTHDHSGGAKGVQVTAASIKAEAWTSFTPTLTAATTNPTGWTQTGYYMQIGKTVIVKFKLTAGASMTAGSGNYRIALPVNANTTIGDIDVGVVFGYDSSATATVFPSVFIPNTAYVQMAYAATHLGTLTAVTGAAPWTWAANDFIRGTIVYEAA